MHEEVVFWRVLGGVAAVTTLLSPRAAVTEENAAVGRLCYRGAI